MNNLYIGSIEDACNNNVICKVTHILNVADELMFPSRKEHQYLKYGINDDDETEDISRILERCVQWTDDALKEGGSILIHGLEGKSRTACVCIAFLCLKRCYNFENALNHILLVRPCIDIFPLYLQQTKKYIHKRQSPKRRCCFFPAICHFLQ